MKQKNKWEIKCFRSKQKRKEAEFYVWFRNRERKDSTSLQTSHEKKSINELKPNSFSHNIFVFFKGKKNLQTNQRSKSDNTKILAISNSPSARARAPRRPFSFSFLHRWKTVPLEMQRKSCLLDEVATDGGRQAWDREKCPIKNLSATSAPWTVQCIYQCHQSSKATDFSEAWCGTWPLTCTECRQIWEEAVSHTKTAFLFRAQRSALKEMGAMVVERGRVAGGLCISSVCKKGWAAKCNLFCTKRLIYNCLI